MIQEEFVAKILEILSPMPDVTAIKSKGHIVLYKDGVMFGKIIEQSVLLLSNGNKFIEVDTELINRLLIPKNKIDQSDLDTFLFEVNKAQWLTKGETITILNIKDIFNKDLICSKAIINYKYNFVY